MGIAIMAHAIASLASLARSVPTSIALLIAICAASVLMEFVIASPVGLDQTAQLSFAVSALMDTATMGPVSVNLAFLGRIVVLENAQTCAMVMAPVSKGNVTVVLGIEALGAKSKSAQTIAATMDIATSRRRLVFAPLVSLVPIVQLIIIRECAHTCAPIMGYVLVEFVLARMVSRDHTVLLPPGSAPTNVAAKELVIMGLAHASQDTLERTAQLSDSVTSALMIAPFVAAASMDSAFVRRDGLVLTAPSVHARVTATTMASASMERVTALMVGLVRNARLRNVQIAVPIMESASTEPVIATKAFQAQIAHAIPAPMRVPTMGFAIMGSACATRALRGRTARCAAA